jgi:hypothetical protein
MNSESKQEITQNNPYNYYVVIINDFFGPQEPKSRLVEASTEEEAKLKTRMGNPDLLMGFARKEDACAFLEARCGTEWAEIEE